MNGEYNTTAYCEKCDTKREFRRDKQDRKICICRECNSKYSLEELTIKSIDHGRRL